MALLSRPERDAESTTYPLSDDPGHDATATWPNSASPAHCPHCAGELVNGQGVLDCLDCAWTN
jgi:hypothetical protein